MLEEDSLVGQQLGRFRIGAVLGTGGMGAVYRGVDEILGRNVAVKTLRGLDHDESLAQRLEHEARLLSQLNHPNVCQIYEVLRTERGPALVLELVEGRPLNARLDEPHGLRAAIDLVLPIFDALVAAHARGIIHCDLKPGNVMVARDGGVKVLDFGIARLLAGDGPGAGGADAPPPASAPAEGLMTRTAVHRTATRSATGTLAYMAPEQARGDPLSAAADIYALGLVLQELLTGDRARSARLPVPQLLAEIADGRSIRPPEGLPRAVRELILRMTALAPGARPSAEDARSRLLQIRDAPRRTRVRAAGVGVFVAFTLLAAKYTVDLRAALAEATEARQRAEETSRFALNLFRDAAPVRGGRTDLSAVDLVERGIGRIEAAALAPSTRLRLYELIAQVLAHLDQNERRVEVLAEAVRFAEAQGLPPAEARSVQLSYAVALELADRVEESQALGDALLADARRQGDRLFEAEVLARITGATPRATLERAEQALALLRAFPSKGLNDAGLVALYELEIVASSRRLRALHRLGRAEECAAFDLDDVQPKLQLLGQWSRLDLRQMVARCQWAAGRAEEAEQNHRQLLREFEALGAQEGVRVTLQNLAASLMQQHKLEEAEPIYLRLLAEERSHHTLNNLGVLYEALRRYEASERLHLEALAYRRTHLPGSWQLEESVNNLGEIYRRQHRFDESLAMQDECLALSERVFGADNVDAAWCWTARANTLRDMGRFAESEAAYEKALALREAAQRDGHPELSETRAELAELYRRAGRSDEADALLAREGVRRFWMEEHGEGDPVRS